MVPTGCVPEVSGAPLYSPQELEDISGTVRPAVAALFDSLIEPVKRCGVEPCTYLTEAPLRAVRNPGTVTLARDLKSSES